MIESGNGRKRCRVHLIRTLNSYLSVCRKLVVYRVHRKRSTGGHRRIFPRRLIDATPYFPFRLHKPPGETIETAIERDRRDFSPSRANSLCILSRRMNTRPFLSVAQRTALSIIEPHPRCALRRCGRERI